MSTYSTGVVLVRLFAIYLAITSLQSLFFYLPSLVRSVSQAAQQGVSISFWTQVIAVFLPVACAIVIWRRADAIVPNGADSAGDHFSSAELMPVGVSLLGLYLFVWGVISAVRVESALALTVQMDHEAGWAQRLPYITQILIAAAMLLRRRWLSATLSRLKYAGTDKG